MNYTTVQALRKRAFGDDFNANPALNGVSQDTPYTQHRAYEKADAESEAFAESPTGKNTRDVLGAGLRGAAAGGLSMWEGLCDANGDLSVLLANLGKYSCRAPWALAAKAARPFSQSARDWLQGQATGVDARFDKWRTDQLRSMQYLKQQARSLRPQGTDGLSTLQASEWIGHYGLPLIASFVPVNGAPAGWQALRIGNQIMNPVTTSAGSSALRAVGRGAVSTASKVPAVGAAVQRVAVPVSRAYTATGNVRNALGTASTILSPLAVAASAYASSHPKTESAKTVQEYLSGLSNWVSWLSDPASTAANNALATTQDDPEQDNR